VWINTGFAGSGRNELPALGSIRLGNLQFEFITLHGGDPYLSIFCTRNRAGIAEEILVLASHLLNYNKHEPQQSKTQSIEVDCVTGWNMELYFTFCVLK